MWTTTRTRHTQLCNRFYVSPGYAFSINPPIWYQRYTAGWRIRTRKNLKRVIAFTLIFLVYLIIHTRKPHYPVRVNFWIYFFREARCSHSEDKHTDEKAECAETLVSETAPYFIVSHPVFSTSHSMG